MTTNLTVPSLLSEKTPQLRVIAVTHAKVTLITFAVAVPVPLVIVQNNPVGWVFTVTAYAPLTFVANVKLVAPLATVRSSPALFCNTNPVAESPVIVPPIV